jgi:hypothetical protein
VSAVSVPLLVVLRPSINLNTDSAHQTGALLRRLRLTDIRRRRLTVSKMP